MKPQGWNTDGQWRWNEISSLQPAHWLSPHYKLEDFFSRGDHCKLSALTTRRRVSTGFSPALRCKVFNKVKAPGSRNWEGLQPFLFCSYSAFFKACLPCLSLSLSFSLPEKSFHASLTRLTFWQVATSDIWFVQISRLINLPVKAETLKGAKPSGYSLTELKLMKLWDGEIISVTIHPRSFYRDVGNWNKCLSQLSKNIHTHTHTHLRTHALSKHGKKKGC